MGIFDAFVARSRACKLIGVEAGGRGIRPGEHAARFAGGSAGVLQGTRSYVLQDDERQHRADPFDLGRPRLRRGRARARLAARHRPRRIRLDRRRRGAGGRFSGWRARKASCRRSSRRTRSPTPAGWRRRCGADEILLVNLSGRGDKDVLSVQKALSASAERRPMMSRLAGDVPPDCATTAAAASSPTSPPAIPIARRSADRARRGGARRRGRARGRRAVLGSAGRRSGDPARQRAGAGRRHDAARIARPGARVPRPRIDTPIVLFTYANPVLRMDAETFARRRDGRRRRRRAGPRLPGRGGGAAAGAAGATPGSIRSS